jgi:hypothetical protein
MREGDLVAGRFELLRLAGAGGMARVFLARDALTSELVAVKVAEPADAAEALRFAREAELLSELRHPGIVRYLAHGRVEGDYYLVMEWLEGEDFAQRLRRGPLAIDEAVRLARRVSEALALAHARGVVHRDVKPSNLFLPRGEIDRVKVLDFGVAALDAATRRLTRTGATMGTPGYMAPEQARGARAVDPRADLFALGCVLFECLAGRPAFVAGHAMALLGMILFEDAPRARSLRPEVPAELDELVARLLAKAPDDRPADAHAVVDALDRLPSADGAASPGPAAASSLTRSEQRLVSVVATSLGLGRTMATSTVPSTAADASPLLALRGAAERHGARLEVLADGSAVAVLPSSSTPAELATRAARCALEMRAALPGAPMVLTTGRATLEGRLPVGEVIDRAASALADAPLDTVRVDGPTAELLEGRFDLARAGGAADLRRELDAAPLACPRGGALRRARSRARAAPVDASRVRRRRGRCGRARARPRGLKQDAPPPRAARRDRGERRRRRDPRSARRSAERGQPLRHAGPSAAPARRRGGRRRAGARAREAAQARAGGARTRRRARHALPRRDARDPVARRPKPGDRRRARRRARDG